MTADEFRKILDRFHQGLADADKWACDRIALGGIRPEWSIDLHTIWCDLNRECALMKDAERRIMTNVLPLETAVKVGTAAADKVAAWTTRAAAVPVAYMRVD